MEYVRASFNWLAVKILKTFKTASPQETKVLSFYKVTAVKQTKKNNCNEMYKYPKIHDISSKKGLDMLLKLVSTDVTYTFCRQRTETSSIELIQAALANLIAVDMCFPSRDALLGTVCCLRLQWNSTIISGLMDYGSIRYCLNNFVPFIFLRLFFF